MLIEPVWTRSRDRTNIYLGLPLFVGSVDVELGQHFLGGTGVGVGHALMR